MEPPVEDLQKSQGGKTNIQKPINLINGGNSAMHLSCTVTAGTSTEVILFNLI